MKNFILLFALLASLALPLSAQNWFANHPHWASFFSFGFAGAGYEFASVEGDTVVQGLSATKVVRFRELVSGSHSDIRVARQHGDTIWLWNANTAAYYLAYNFSLAVGDSVALPLYWGGGEFKYTIDSMGTLLMDNQALRFQRIRFSFVNLNSSHCQSLLIETIGFVNGSCPNMGFDFLYGGHFFLDERNEGFVDGPEWAFCQYYNDFLSYSDPIDWCDALTSEEEPIKALSTFRVQPNPFHDAFTVTDSGEETPAYLRIFNTSGRLVRQTPPPFGSVSAAGLPPGLYFIEITSASGQKQICRATRL